jgi:ATP-dependent Lon protease
MPKRPARGSGKSRACSGDLGDSAPPPKKTNTRDGTLWVDDDTLKSSSPPQEEKPVILIINKDDSDYDPEYDDDEEYIPSSSDNSDADFEILIKRRSVKPYEEVNLFNQQAKKKNPPRRKDSFELPKGLSKSEQDYLRKQNRPQRNELLELIKKINSIDLDEGDVPNKFKVLKMPIPDYTKSIIIKKLNSLAEMTDNGESYKLKSWMDAFFRIPFGTYIPLPVSIMDGQEKCTEFMIKARTEMDKTIYGMNPAKIQIMQIIAQLIVNPSSVGNVIALAGPPGVGKTSFARNAIAQVLKRPFEFFSLGGASDISSFVGHSYTYEGSIWGRIADALMRTKVMNPVIYFDELDKVSGTPHGEEIISMMIHMTDRSQNTQFHDRYFSGIDFDLSQCIFVFSFNDIEKVHPILRDRMTVINCSGYSEADKKVILKDYIWNQLLKTLMFDSEQLILKDDAISYLISEYSKDEKGVRTLIRTVETMMTRLNMLRVASHPSMKDYKFYMDFQLPMTLNETIVKKLLIDLDKKNIESWRTMYT